MSRVLLALLVSLLLVNAGLAQTPDFQSVELTHDGANRALDAMLDVYDVGQRYKDRLPSGDGENMLGRLTGFGLYSQAKTELDGAVAKHGFASYEEWLATVQSLFHAFAFAQSRDAMAAVAPAMQQALDKIRNDPNIPEAQKQMLIERMGAMAGTAPGANPPSLANQDIALELLPRIEAVSDAMKTR